MAKALIQYNDGRKPEFKDQVFGRAVFMIQQGLAKPQTQKDIDYVATVQRVVLDRYDKATPKAYLELYPVETSFVDDYKSFK